MSESSVKAKENNPQENGKITGKQWICFLIIGIVFLVLCYPVFPGEVTPETFSKLRGCTETGIPTEIQEKSYTKMEVIYGEAYFDIAYFLYEDAYYLIECTKGQLFQLDGEFQMKLASDRLDGLVQDGAYAYYAGGDWKTRFSLLAGFTAGQDISVKRPVYYRLDLATMQEKKITLKEYWDICKPYEQLM